MSDRCAVDVGKEPEGNATACINTTTCTCFTQQGAGVCLPEARFGHKTPETSGCYRSLHSLFRNYQPLQPFPQPPRENINENSLAPLPPATMLAMTRWFRRRCALLTLLVHDRARRRNFVAGGRGERVLVYFFPFGASAWEASLT